MQIRLVFSASNRTRIIIIHVGDDYGDSGRLNKASDVNPLILYLACLPMFITRALSRRVVGG